MKAKKIRPFIPSIDFETSISFYKDLGFEITYEEDKLIVLTSGDISFFLQNYYQKEWANNTMIQLFVDDLDAFYDVAHKLEDKYKGVKTKPIFTAHYGKTFHLIGPAGELWHMME